MFHVIFSQHGLHRNNSTDHNKLYILFHSHSQWANAQAWWKIHYSEVMLNVNMCARTHTEKRPKNTAYKEHNTHWKHKTMCVLFVFFFASCFPPSLLFCFCLLPPSSSPSGHLCTACYPLAWGGVWQCDNPCRCVPLTLWCAARPACLCGWISVSAATQLSTFNVAWMFVHCVCVRVQVCVDECAFWCAAVTRCFFFSLLIRRAGWCICCFNHSGCEGTCCLISSISSARLSHLAWFTHMKVLLLSLTRGSVHHRERGGYHSSQSNRSVYWHSSGIFLVTFALWNYVFLEIGIRPVHFYWCF